MLEQSRIGRRKMITAGAAAAAGGAALLVGPATVGAANGGQFDDEAAIKQLSVNYALGTDAIGRGNATTGLDHMAAAGVPFYEKAFTPDFTFKLFLAGNPSPVVTVSGIQNWANFVAGAFNGGKYRETQHLLGTLNVELSGNTAEMSSYLHATHVRPPQAPDTVERSSIFVGVYRDIAIRRNGVWRISERSLFQTVSYWVPGPPA